VNWYSEEILKIAFDDRGDLIVDGDRVVAGHHVVQRARLKVDTVKWIMAKLAPKTYGDRPVVTEEQQAITVQWQATETTPPIAPAPPRQIEYRKPELPGDLTEADWSAMLPLWSW
jgi:terminase small subunit-like protein